MLRVTAAESVNAEGVVTPIRISLKPFQNFQYHQTAQSDHWLKLRGSSYF